MGRRCGGRRTRRRTLPRIRGRSARRFAFADRPQPGFGLNWRGAGHQRAIGDARRTDSHRNRRRLDRPPTRRRTWGHRRHDHAPRIAGSERRPAVMSSALVFRKGLDLKHAVAAQLTENYHSELVEKIKADGFLYNSGRLTVHLAREFGFCYGVDRAVDYAYQTRQRFPDRRIFLTGEI